MPTLYRFRRLIEKYSTVFLLEAEPGGRYVHGEWVPGQPVRTKQRGAVIPLAQRQIYESGGRLTEADRTLYVDQSIAIPPKSKIHYRGQTYHVEQFTPFEEFGDFNRFVLKHVSAFDEGAT